MVLDDMPYHDEDIPITEFYKLLVQESKSVKWPVEYKTDLTRHDKMTLYAYKPERFIWILREWGTHMILFQEQKDFITYHLEHTPKAFYYYASYNSLSGYNLQCIPPDKILNCLQNLPKFEEKG